MNVNNLILRLQKGDNSAFDKYYEQTKRLVYVTIYDIVHNKEVAEDVMQDTYLTILNSLDSYKKNVSGLAWTVVIARNKALNEIKKSKREVFTDFADESSSPKIAFEENYMMPTLECAKSCLTESEYELVVLCTIKGFKRVEVAKMHNAPISTINFQYNKALKKIKEYLKRGEVLV